MVIQELYMYSPCTHAELQTNTRVFYVMKMVGCRGVLWHSFKRRTMDYLAFGVKYFKIAFIFTLKWEILKIFKLTKKN